MLCTRIWGFVLVLGTFYCKYGGRGRGEERGSLFTWFLDVLLYVPRVYIHGHRAGRERTALASRRRLTIQQKIQSQENRYNRKLFRMGLL